MVSDISAWDDVAARAGDLVRQGYHGAEAMLLTVGEHVLDDLEPRCARMATGFAEGVDVFSQARLEGR
ncbi:MAG: hypothetical protein ISS49_02845 [Anaerolineae bacterium]|nr:hypothetical protein [Anaerolineae bacterium]